MSGPADGTPWWRVPLYPAAVPAAFTIAVWSTALLHPVWLVRPMAMVVAISVLLTLVLVRATGDAHRGALAAWALVVALVVDDPVASGLLAIAGIVIVAAGLALRGPWARGPLVTRGLGIFCTVVLLASLIHGVQVGAIRAAFEDLGADTSTPRAADVAGNEARDIWIILLDGHPGADAVRRLDPAATLAGFHAALTERGFDVHESSRTNYLLTPLVLASMFGNEHISTLLPYQPSQSLASVMRDLRVVTDRGVVLKTLAESGYERIVVTSGWSELGLRRVDRVLDLPEISEFEVALLRTTGLGNVIGAIDPNAYSEQTRSRIRSTFSAAMAIAAEPSDGPRFVFVHVPAPHLPAVFGPAGEPVNGSTGSMVDTFRQIELGDAEEARRMLDQTTYIDAQVLPVVDEIVRRSDRTPVIAIFSDHGSDVRFIGRDPLASDLVERTSNVMAVLSPGEPGLLPPGTTPIGILPRLLNTYAGTDLPIREDSIWAWRSGATLLDVVELDPATLR